MIAHVAEAGEERGRVVLQLVSGRPSIVAIRAAIHVAQAFKSELESLFVEDEQLFALAEFAFAREVSAGGQGSRKLTLEDLEQDLRAVGAALGRRIEALARAAEVPLRSRIVRDEPLSALVSACAERGPWNVVALADPIGAADGHALRRLLDTVTGTTGIVVVGPSARRTTGPVVIALEGLDHLSGMLRAAERLAAISGGEIVLLLIGEDDAHLAWMDAQARLLLGEREDVRIAEAEIARGAPAVVAEALRRIEAGFVVAESGRLVLPNDGDLKALAIALECPLFVVR